MVTRGVSGKELCDQCNRSWSTRNSWEQCLEGFGGSSGASLRVFRHILQKPMENYNPAGGLLRLNIVRPPSSSGHHEAPQPPPRAHFATSRTPASIPASCANVHRALTHAKTCKTVKHRLPRTAKRRRHALCAHVHSHARLARAPRESVSVPLSGARSSGNTTRAHVHARASSAQARTSPLGANAVVLPVGGVRPSNTTSITEHARACSAPALARSARQGTDGSAAICVTCACDNACTRTCKQACRRWRYPQDQRGCCRTSITGKFVQLCTVTHSLIHTTQGKSVRKRDEKRVGKGAKALPTARRRRLNHRSQGHLRPLYKTFGEAWKWRKCEWEKGGIKEMEVSK